MKKVFRFFTIAAIAFGMTMAVSCNKDDDDNGGNGGNGGNTDNGPAVLVDEAFESGIPTTWQTLDVDGDGDTWQVLDGSYGVDGSKCACSQSYDNNVGALTPDNYLVTPEVTLAGEYTLTFQVNAQDASWAAEHYAVLVGTIQNGTFVSQGTLLEEDVVSGKDQSPWQTKTLSLKDYKGKTVSIAFRHFNCTDMFRMNIDNVKIAK